jgi:enterochelin esterase-like enzyme
VVSKPGQTAVLFQSADEDFLLDDNTTMNALMISYGIRHSFETYDGDHVNRVPQRFEENMLPFFSEHLATKAP